MPTETPRARQTVGGLAGLRVRTINHRAQGLANLSRLTAGASSDDLHASLSACGVESVLLSTCNRRELYWRAKTDQDDDVVTRLLETTLGLEPGGVATESTLIWGASAARHLFRVCAGLESAVVGEAEILGQVRGALETSPRAGFFLTGIFRAALRAGGAARAETSIGEGALSVVSTAIQWLGGQVPFAESRILILGAGHTARKAARHLKALGVSRLVIANRTRSRAEALAASLDAEIVGLDEVSDTLHTVDAVVSAVSVREWVITRDHLERRKGPRPIVVVDLSMPPSIEPVNIAGVVHVDLTLLDQSATANRRRREAEAPRVEVVLAREMEHLQRWASREAARPAMSVHRREVDAIRRAELEIARQELRASSDPGEVLDRFSQRLFDRMFAYRHPGSEGLEA